MEDIVIVSAVRTPVGKFGGALAHTPATELGSIVIKEALARAKVGMDQVARSSWVRCWQPAAARIRRARR